MREQPHDSCSGTTHDERGTAMVSVLVLSVIVAGLAYASMATSVSEVRDSQRSKDRVAAFWLARAGAEMATASLDDAAHKTAIYDPLFGVRNLFDNGAGGYRDIVYLDDFPIQRAGATYGTVTVSMSIVSLADSVEVTIASTGYVRVGGASSNRQVSQAVEWVVRLSEETSVVFDNAYFINNWGWFYGDPIYCNGNVRSNGQFDAGGYRPAITGQPIYDELVWNSGKADLVGYQDDNGDGNKDGNDGGIFAAWDIVRADRVRENGGDASNQHAFTESAEMPNLSDLSRWEAKAIATGGTITVGGVVVASGVVGDDPSEPQNLYLSGTAADPVQISGTVVVRGDLVIHGVVEGQGAIFAGRNAYVPNDLTYKNGPTTTRPVDNTEAETEDWITANKDRDLLGLFASENVVMGDFTDWRWRTTVGPWLSHTLNRSDEDAGVDGIPNTQAGKDGIAGTADDDLLENDGVFTTEVYTTGDAAFGLIPPGFAVGDPVPGSGEDIDGDGVRDSTIGLSDFDLSRPISAADWGGNVPSGGIASYSTIGNLGIGEVNGVFYTNHAAAMYSNKASGFQISGSLISRNEAMVFRGKLTLDYDCRLLGRNTGMGSEFLPKTFEGSRVVSRRMLDHDPNRSAP